MERNYYPGGLLHKGYNNEIVLTENNLKTYQGQEWTDDFGLNSHEWKYRVSDPTTLRFWQLDPLAEEYSYNSPYAFQENKLGIGIELEGLEVQEWDDYTPQQRVLLRTADDIRRNKTATGVPYFEVGIGYSSKKKKKFEAGQPGVAGVKGNVNVFTAKVGMEFAAKNGEDAMVVGEVDVLTGKANYTLGEQSTTVKGSALHVEGSYNLDSGEFSGNANALDIDFDSKDLTDPSNDLVIALRYSIAYAKINVDEGARVVYDLANGVRSYFKAFADEWFKGVNPF